MERYVNFVFEIHSSGQYLDTEIRYLWKLCFGGGRSSGSRRRRVLILLSFRGLAFALFHRDKERKITLTNILTRHSIVSKTLPKCGICCLFRPKTILMKRLQTGKLDTKLNYDDSIQVRNVITHRAPLYTESFKTPPLFGKSARTGTVLSVINKILAVLLVNNWIVF